MADNLYELSYNFNRISFSCVVDCREIPVLARFYYPADFQLSEVFMHN